MSISFGIKDLKTLIASAREAGYRFVAPVEESGGTTVFAETEDAEKVKLPRVQTTVSPKEFFFPKCECLFRYKAGEGGKTEITDADPAEFAPPTVIFGARPCDAAAPAIMREVMTWDYDDEFFTRRLDATVVVAIACDASDEACFCTSVGLAPDSEEGADVMLTPCGRDGNFTVKAVTDKGKKFVDGTKGWSEEYFTPSPGIAATKEKLAPRFDPAKVKGWLDDNFENDFWKTATLACVGCATCSYLCPTCHCFDIVDEGNAEEGARVKNWDYCQSKLFTLHTSGHNPRADQSARQRQRIMHKFKYYVDNFGRLLCTGCGRCQRHCPADMAMVEVVEKIDGFAGGK